MVVITSNFSLSDISAAVEKQAKSIRKASVSRFVQVGAKFVDNARNLGEYLNHTFNLRSSIAYAVLNDGKVVKSDYKRYKKGVDGVLKAKGLIEEISSNCPEGVVLIVVAGEDYAASVESRGKDVLTGSSIWIKRELRKLLK